MSPRETTVRNSISTAALSEFVNEVRAQPEEAALGYGVQVTWESGARSQAAAKTMTIGPHRVSRSFSWKVDEPRQLLGTNHAANPQEYLLSGLGACIVMSFIAGASARGIQIETLSVDVEADLDLRGFLGLESNKPTGLSHIRYHIAVSGDATPEQFEELRRHALARSPNANTIRDGVPMDGALTVR
jgi:uncharacterized OsmC-like protein